LKIFNCASFLTHGLTTPTHARFQWIFILDVPLILQSDSGQFNFKNGNAILDHLGPSSKQQSNAPDVRFKQSHLRQPFFGPEFPRRIDSMDQLAPFFYSTSQRILDLTLQSAWQHHHPFSHTNEVQALSASMKTSVLIETLAKTVDMSSIEKWTELDFLEVGESKSVLLVETKSSAESSAPPSGLPPLVTSPVTFPEQHL
jgi:hypothetical protein